MTTLDNVKERVRNMVQSNKRPTKQMLRKIQVMLDEVTPVIGTPCDDCRASGFCSSCNGTGYCPDCEGIGKCSHCEGEGVVE